MIHRFRAAPLDRAALVRTIATLAGLGALVILLLIIRQIAPVAGLLLLPVIIIPAVAYASTPLGYALDEHTLTIERKTLRRVRIPLASISACYPLPRGDLRRTIRIYGTGGLFGWSGRYRDRTLGSFSMHASSLDRMVVIRTRTRKPLVISPEDPEAFLVCLGRQYETLVIPPR